MKFDEPGIPDRAQSEWNDLPADPNPNSYGHLNRNADCIAYRHRYCDCDSFTDRHCDRNPNRDADRYRD